MAVSSDRRGVWGRWLVQQRKAHGDLTQEAVRSMLAKMGHPISEAYYGDFERGKVNPPSPEWQDVFKRLWGELPEAEPSQAVSALQSAADQSEVVAELREQNAILREQVAVVTRLAVALEALLVPRDEHDLGLRGELSIAAADEGDERGRRLVAQGARLPGANDE